MNLMKWVTAYACKLGLEVMCRIHKENWEAIPASGPLIAYANHTGSVEAPLIYTQMMPRSATALAKSETWDNWFLGWIFTLWEIIPIRRGEADMEALRAAPISAHLEVETYTFEVLPEALRVGGVEEAIARELAWARERLA